MFNSDSLLFHTYCPHGLAVVWKRYCLQCVVVEDDLEGLTAICYRVDADEGLRGQQLQLLPKACRHGAEWVRYSGVVVSAKFVQDP